MRIRKYGDQPAEQFIEARKAVNVGCDVCPCCSHSPIHRTAYRNISDHERVDVYKCPVCGAEWETDPYPYATKSDTKYDNKIMNQILYGLRIEKIEYQYQNCADTINVHWSVLASHYNGIATLQIKNPLTIQCRDIPSEYRLDFGKALLQQLLNTLCTAD